jgi:hypothetical protein
MNTKHIFPAILIFAAILLFSNRCQAQNTSDELKVVRDWFLGYTASQHGKILTYSQLINITRDNVEACKYVRKAYSCKTAGVFFGVVGGGCLGFSLGYVLSLALYDSPIEMKIFLPFIAAGAGMVVCSITFDALATQNLRKGVDIFNKSIKQKNSTNIDLGFMPNGMFLRFNF